MTHIRPLERSDDDQLTQLLTESFGEWTETGPHVNQIDSPGRHTWVAEDAGRVVGLVVDCEFDTWFGGATIPTAGIASVGVQAEYRGQGLLTPMFDAMLASARERGALISTLYPSSPGIYRRFGYAPIVALEDVHVPTRALAVPGDTVPTRRATASDLPAIRAVYQRWAADQNGPLTRVGAAFPDSDTAVLAAVSGYTVAESPDGTVTGYASWSRGAGYGADAQITVSDLLADDIASLTSLMKVLASFDSVAPTTVIRSSGHAEWMHLVRTGSLQTVLRREYGMAVLDVAVLEHLGYPDGLEVALPFNWRGVGYVLTVSNGRGHVETAEVGGARALDAGGLALIISGAQRSGALRRLGHLSGDPRDDEFWDFLFGSRQPHVLNYF
jgi:predicted acetyltransferase